MPDEPTTGGAGNAPGQVPEQPGPNHEQPAAPPFDEQYRWFGPARSAHGGAESPPPGSQYPHGSSQQPYDYSQQAPYGQAQGPYAHSQGPYAHSQGPPQYGWPYVPPPPPRPPLSPEQRRRRTRRGLALAGALVLAVGAGIGIGASIAPTSPASVAGTLLNRAITAATRAGTYHYVELSTVAGAPYDIEGDAAPNGGQQVIKQRCSPVRSETTNSTSTFDLRLVHGVVYFRGNIVAVVDELGVAGSRATSLAGKWVKLVKGEKPYTTFEEGITASSNASQLRTAIFPTSSRTLSSSSPPSTEVVGAALQIKKQTLGTAVLVMDTSTGRPRALRGSAALEDTERYTVTWTFSRYSEQVHVAAPAHPVPYSSLHATPPPKTTCS